MAIPMHLVGKERVFAGTPILCKLNVVAFILWILYLSYYGLIILHKFNSQTLILNLS